MASLAELESRIETIEQKIANAIPLDWIDVNSPGDISQKYVYGIGIGARSSINNGKLISGWKVKPNTPNPTSDSDFETPYGFSQ